MELTSHTVDSIVQTVLVRKVPEQPLATCFLVTGLIPIPLYLFSKF